jgi:hypothetical protein
MDVISIVSLVLISLLLARPAYAYIDPSAGGMLIQLLTGGVAGLAVLARLYWRSIKSTLWKETSTQHKPRQAGAPAPASDERG